VNQIATQTATETHVTTAAREKLARLATNMNDLVLRFKT